ncbi:MAG: hypothetical protein IJ165_08485 [Proteobacteria bacterium]|nr:hypothetical protein [Pseudomonadota bacterium]
MKATGHNQLTDIMLERKDRPSMGVYFLRINSYSIQVEQLLRQALQRARKSGVLIDGKLAAPDVRQITYYQEMIGDEFDLDLSFIERSISKWLPRLSFETVKLLANAIFTMLSELKQLGKNINILKNAFIKYMCWLFYKFSQVASNLMASMPPLILYAGEISIYELQMLSILHKAGCDIMLLQTHGDQSYLKLDPNQKYSNALEIPGGTGFPENYTLKTISDALNAIARQQSQSNQPKPLPNTSQAKQNPVAQTIQAPHASPQHQIRPAPSRQQTQISPAPIRQNQTQNNALNALRQNQPQNPPSAKPARINMGQPTRTSPQQNTPTAQPAGPKPLDFGPEPHLKLNTNQWLTLGNPLKDILTPFAVRSSDASHLCNAFCRICGVPSPSTYENDLYQFYQKLNTSGRRIILIENGLPTPTPDEISKIKRGNYRFAEDMIRDLMVNFSFGVSQELAKYTVSAFGKILLEESKKPNTTLGKLTATAVYLICWFRKYQNNLFSGWKAPATPCFIYFGTCNNDKDILFMRMLAYMPVDVLLIQPNLNEICTIEDTRLKTEMSLDSLNLSEFPKNARLIHVTTESYQAERDLDDIDTGIYRNQQFSKAKAVPLHTARHEIDEIWHQAILDRTNTEITQGVVNFPVLFSKISGVSQDKEEDYWLYVKQFITNETVVLSKLPFSSMTASAQEAASFYRNGKLIKDRIKSSRTYAYNLLRNDMQDHMLNCLQELLDTKLIRSTYNTEQLIISAAMSLNRDICRLIQQFDFTRNPPKILILHTREALGNIQDAVQLAFLGMIGFDILIFAPTGYQCIEQWYNFPIVDEHQAGPYHYDYKVPDFNTLGEKQSWFSRFRRN